MDHLSNLFGLASAGYTGYTNQKAAEANKSAAAKQAAAQNKYTETIKQYAPIAILIVGGLLIISLFGRGK